MTDQVRAILARVFALDAERIGPDFSQDLHEPWDSLAQLRIVVELEGAFGCQFEPREIGQLTDLGAIVALLERKRA